MSALRWVNSHPPVSWTVRLLLWLGGPLDRWLDAPVRAYARRRAVEYGDLAQAMRAAGLHESAAVLTIAADAAQRRAAAHDEEQG